MIASVRWREKFGKDGAGYTTDLDWNADSSENLERAWCEMKNQNRTMRCLDNYSEEQLS